jgi:hypothetical protein
MPEWNVCYLGGRQDFTRPEIGNCKSAQPIADPTKTDRRVSSSFHNLHASRRRERQQRRRPKSPSLPIRQPQQLGEHDRTSYSRQLKGRARKPLPEETTLDQRRQAGNAEFPRSAPQPLASLPLSPWIQPLGFHQAGAQCMSSRTNATSSALALIMPSMSSYTTPRRRSSARCSALLSIRHPRRSV